MPNTDSFGQSKPTFTEDPIAATPVYRDSQGASLGISGHRSNRVVKTKVHLENPAPDGTPAYFDLPELAHQIVRIERVVISSGVRLADAAVSTNYTVSRVAKDNPDIQAIGDPAALATESGGTDSFGQTKPTFQNTGSGRAAADALNLDYKHFDFPDHTTRITVVGDESLNYWIVTYEALTNLAHGDSHF